MKYSNPLPRRLSLASLSSSQRGVALVTVLMVFAIGAILVSQMVLQRSVDVQRVANIVGRTQAQFYARAGEDLAILGLRQADELNDGDRNFLNHDSLEEDWAGQLPPYELDGFGQMAIRIIDLNRFYNINNMLEPDGEINTNELQRFKHLLVELNLSEDLGDNVADWLDENDSQLGYNSESDFYLNGELSYRAANRAIFDVRELLQIDGFDKEVLEVLAPHIIALPIRDILALNVNTATRYALTTLEEDVVNRPRNRDTIGLQGADSIIDERPYEDDSDFINNSGVTDPVSESEYQPSGGQNQTPPARGRTTFSRSSEYFEINVRANYAGHVAYLTTIVKQEGVGANARYIVLSRDETDNSARFVQQF